MVNSLQDKDTQLKEIMGRLVDLQLGIKRWITRCWMRAAEFPSSKEEAKNCSWCKGVGEAHFCINGFSDCGSDHMEDCVHPNEVEVTELTKMQMEARRLTERMIDIQKTEMYALNTH